MKYVIIIIIIIFRGSAGFIKGRNVFVYDQIVDIHHPRFATKFSWTYPATLRVKNRRTYSEEPRIRKMLRIIGIQKFLDVFSVRKICSGIRLYVTRSAKYRVN